MTTELEVGPENVPEKYSEQNVPRRREGSNASRYENKIVTQESKSLTSSTQRL